MIRLSTLYKELTMYYTIQERRSAFGSESGCVARGVSCVRMDLRSGVWVTRHCFQSLLQLVMMRFG